jgi:hypothetical protein
VEPDKYLFYSPLNMLHGFTKEAFSGVVIDAQLHDVGVLSWMQDLLPLVKGILRQICLMS